MLRHNDFVVEQSFRFCAGVDCLSPKNEPEAGASGGTRQASKTSVVLGSAPKVVATRSESRVAAVEHNKFEDARSQGPHSIQKRSRSGGPSSRIFENQVERASRENVRRIGLIILTR